MECKQNFPVEVISLPLSIQFFSEPPPERVEVFLEFVVDPFTL